LVTGWHSWPQVVGAPITVVGADPQAQVHQTSSAINAAAAVMAGVTNALGLAALLLALNFAAFFLLGVPELLLLPVAAAAWGVQLGFGGGAPLAGPLDVAGGILVLSLTVNTGAGLPIFVGLAFGAGSRIDRLRAAWADYFAIFRSIVLPLCAAFGVCVAALLIRG
jgi:hypothetical protein